MLELKQRVVQTAIKFEAEENKRELPEVFSVAGIKTAEQYFQLDCEGWLEQALQTT